MSSSFDGSRRAFALNPADLYIAALREEWTGPWTHIVSLPTIAFTNNVSAYLGHASWSAVAQTTTLFDNLNTSFSSASGAQTETHLGADNPPQSSAYDVFIDWLVVESRIWFCKTANKKPGPSMGTGPIQGVQFVDVEWNHELAPGESTSFGFCANR